MSGPIITDIAPGQLSADRGLFFNASDTPAMLGISPYTTRQELLERIKYGVRKAITSQTQRIFDEGHRIESLARPIAEALIGDRLPPKRATLGKFGATLDGYTVDDVTLDGINWECKSLNAAIRAAFARSGYDDTHGISECVILPSYLCAQMEHQLMCSGAVKCLFSAANLDGEAVHCWYHPDATMRQRIIDGWAQFEADLADMPDVMPAAIVGELMPVVREFPFMPLVGFGIVKGSLQDVARFEKEGRDFVATINQSLVTDQDFADGESDKKNLAQAVEMLDALLNAPQDMAALKRVRELFNKARLSLESQLTTRKQARKNELLKQAQRAYTGHISALDVAEYMPLFNVDFAGAIKGKSSFASMQNALDAEVMKFTVEANILAARIRENVAMIAATNAHYLFPDSRVLVLKSREDLANLIAARVAAKEAAAIEKARVDAERKESARIEIEGGEIIDLGWEEPTLESLFVAPVTPSPKINIGQINEALKVCSVTRAQLIELGFPGVEGKIKTRYEWPESDLPGIKAAIVGRLSK